MTTVITVGQELVVPGELVEVDFQATEEMPAAASPSASAADLACPRMNAIIDAAINRAKTTLLVLFMGGLGRPSGARCHSHRQRPQHSGALLRGHHRP